MNNIIKAVKIQKEQNDIFSKAMGFPTLDEMMSFIPEVHTCKQDKCLDASHWEPADEPLVREGNPIEQDEQI